jgi:hypothetical protein
VATATSLGIVAIQFKGAAQLRADLRSLGLPLAA